MLSSWRCCVFLIVLNGMVIYSNGAKKCPSQDTILPCRCSMKREEIQIWCSHSDLPRVLEGLKSVGKTIQESIDELILENNYLPSLPGRAFLPLKIMRLMLRHNGIERVSSDWLTSLEKSLVELFIVEADLRSLPDDSLIHLEQLQAITIQTNLMKRLPILSGLQNLRYVQIESLSLMELSQRNFKNLPSLEKLHISNCPRLSRLEANFLQDLPRLHLVNISYCGINWMHPRALTRLPSLKELYLIGNKITDAGMVGRGIRDLTQLELIHLDHNYIDKINEASFVDLPSLKKLYLSNNHITEIQHGAFHHVPKLKSLDLNKNNVRRIHPESFLQPSGSGLEELFLTQNDISHIADLRALLDALPRLTFLDVSYNNLEAIPFGALRGHPTLEQLHLDYNKIHVIDREAFMAMPALRELRLKNNSLSDMLEGPLWNLPSLKGLDLSGNFYRRLDPRHFANLPSLRRIDLSTNELTLIDPATFLGNTALEHVNLSYNGISTIHPATFRNLLKLYELDVRHNRLIEFVPGLPRGIEYVYLSHNQINSIPVAPSSDLDLPSLRMLDMSSNVVQKIPKNSLESLAKLKKLYLGKNLLQQLDDNSLVGLSHLEILDLSDNRLILIHPGALKELMELKILNLRNNRLDVLIPSIFKNTLRLKKLDVSSNKLAEILPGTFTKMRDLQILDVSDNVLVQLPISLSGMKKLRILDLSKNRIKSANPEIINSLTMLTELSLAENFLQELKKGAFNRLNQLKLLHLDNNEFEIIESNAIHSLPVLNALKLNQNKLKEIPNYALNDLPNLQIVELQENQIRSISNNAFNFVPKLLMLNLSHNQFDNLADVGLSNLKSLEMLDLSHNKLSRVASPSLDKMEWLVELKMNDNRICSIRGSPFDGMPRLRVLSLRNNKMSTLPEKGLQKVLNNIALLDVDGNPLSCTCNLMWLSSWLQEISSTGPRCIDGKYIREMRLSREDCSKEAKQIDPVTPGCESDVITGPGVYGTSQFAADLINLKSNMSKPNIKSGNKNNLAPLPEESDYFYDEYIDYPYNETIIVDPNNRNNTKKDNSEKKSSHYTPGDTPTIYAAPKNKTKDIPKGVNNSPSTSGFTFFGVPLPSLNNLLGENKRGKQKSLVNPQIAERKSAIVNKPSRGSGIVNMELPTSPEIQSGGFIPILPGSGGFKPIPNPAHALAPPQIKNDTQAIQPIGISQIQDNPNPVSLPSATTIVPTILNDVPKTQIPQLETGSPVVKEIQQKKDEVSTIAIQEVPITTLLPEIETTSNKETNFSGFEESVTKPASGITKLEPVSKLELADTSNAMINQNQGQGDKIVATPLSALLIPGGQQPVGRPTITKVQSPHVSGSAPLQSDIEYGQINDPLPHNREAKNTRVYPTIEQAKIGDKDEDNVNWYFANYNKTNLEPYIGKSTFSGAYKQCFRWNLVLIVMLLNFIGHFVL